MAVSKQGGNTAARIIYPLDEDDPQVQAARSAHARAYDRYGLDFTEHFVDIPDVAGRIRVVEVGSGPPVVVIPGGVGYGVIWLPLLARLDGYTAYVMDRPGGGLSAGIDHRSYPLRMIAHRSTSALFDHLDLDVAPLIGNSMGGLWSLRFALANPERVSAIALLGCPALYPGTSAPFPMRLASLPGIGGTIVDKVMQAESADDARGALAFLGHPPETVERLPAEFFEAWYRMEGLPHFKRSWVSLLKQAVRLRGAVPQAAFSPDDLGNIASPTVLIWGRDDPFGTVDQGRTGGGYFGDAEFHEIGVGHLPWLDDPETSGEIVRDILP